MTVPVIEMKNIVRSYAVGEGTLVVLKGISVQVDAGDFVAIMGPSGSGKSTLMQIMGLLDRPNSGSYRLLGREVSGLSDDETAALRSTSLGFIFQMFNLLARTSAKDNVMLPMIYSGRPDRETRAGELLRDVGLGDRSGHKPNQLSGGQQQRVAIARALVNDPPILFADEPTGNLASDQADEILKRIVELNNKGITVIMVTHEPDIAAHAKRILRLKDGVIVADERNPSHDVIPAGRKPGSTDLNDNATGPRLTSRRGDGIIPLAELREHFASAVRAMSVNKVRSGLSVLGILIGVAAVIAMLAVGKGAQKSIEARIANLGSNLITLSPGASSTGGVRGEAGATSRLTLQDAKAIEKANPHIRRVEGNVEGGVQVVYQNENASTRASGATPLYESMRNATPYYGRFLTQEEEDQMARVVLLGQTVVNTLFGSENPVGREVKINRINFRVIGILPAKGASTFRDQDDLIIVPLSTAMRRLLGKKYLNSIAIEADGPEAITEVMNDVEQLMRRRHRLGATRENDFRLRNMADLQATLSDTTQTFAMLLGTVAAISLLVGGIGIMNIMLVSVSERTREIGLRKAVGATRRAVLIQFLLESVVLSTVGGVAGILFGGLISISLSKLAGWAAIVTVPSVLLAFFFSAGTGILFGFWPARKASLLSPIEALRYE